eukprot:142800-Pelagomonas_calceolata.AAC.1
MVPFESLGHNLLCLLMFTLSDTAAVALEISWHTTASFRPSHDNVDRPSFRFKWGDFQPDCSADRPVTGPRQST